MKRSGYLAALATAAGGYGASELRPPRRLFAGEPSPVDAGVYSAAVAGLSPGDAAPRPAGAPRRHDHAADEPRPVAVPTSTTPHAPPGTREPGAAMLEVVRGSIAPEAPPPLPPPSPPSPSPADLRSPAGRVSGRQPPADERHLRAAEWWAWGPAGAAAGPPASNGGSTTGTTAGVLTPRREPAAGAGGPSWPQGDQPQSDQLRYDHPQDDHPRGDHATASRLRGLPGRSAGARGTVGGAPRVQIGTIEVTVVPPPAAPAAAPAPAARATAREPRRPDSSPWFGLAQR